MGQMSLPKHGYQDCDCVLLRIPPLLVLWCLSLACPAEASGHVISCPMEGAKEKGTE